MPSPRLPGSGVLKILPFPDRLKYEFLYPIRLVPNLSQYGVGLVFLREVFFVGSSDLTGASFLRFLGTEATNVSKLLAVITLHFPSFPQVYLSLEVSLMWLERGASVPFFGLEQMNVLAFFVFWFCPSDLSSAPSPVCCCVHCIWVASRSTDRY